MFYGDSCEYKGGASGAFSLILFILIIALVAAAIGLLYMRQQNEKKGGASAAPKNDEKQKLVIKPKVEKAKKSALDNIEDDLTKVKK